MKSILKLIIPLIGAFVLVLLGVNRILEYRHYATLESQNRELQQINQTADALDDDAAAITVYKKAVPPSPEIQLRIIQRQWSIALELIHQVQLARRNLILEEETPALMKKLVDHLGEMKNQCSALLSENDSLRREIVWRIYNLQASVKLMTAFLVLQNERNWEKAQGILREAIADFKSAIDVVDRVSGASGERNIPRWNLELLSAQQNVKRFDMVQPPSEGRLQLEDNLEVLIPEKGGYAPGEPIERRVEK